MAYMAPNFETYNIHWLILLSRLTCPDPKMVTVNRAINKNKEREHNGEG